MASCAAHRSDTSTAGHTALAAEPESSLRDALEARARELLRQHGGKWRSEGRLKQGEAGELQRGFIEDLSLHTRLFLSQGERLLAATPFHRLNVTMAGAAEMRELAGSPLLSRLTHLGLSHWFHTKSAVLLADSPHLSRLRRLDVSIMRLRIESVCALVDSLTRLAQLDLNNNHIGAEGAKALARAEGLGALRVLNLTSNRVLPEGLRALATAGWLTSLKKLKLSHSYINDEGLRALATNPYLARLEALVLHDNDFGDDGARALSSSPFLTRLKVLDVSRRNRLGAEGLRAPSTAGRIPGASSSPCRWPWPPSRVPPPASSVRIRSTNRAEYRPRWGPGFCAQRAAEPGDGLDGVEFLRAATRRGWGIASMARAAARWTRFS